MTDVVRIGPIVDWFQTWMLESHGYKEWYSTITARVRERLGWEPDNLDDNESQDHKWIHDRLGDILEDLFAKEWRLQMAVAIGRSGYIDDPRALHSLSDQEQLDFVNEYELIEDACAIANRMDPYVGEGAMINLVTKMQSRTGDKK